MNRPHVTAEISTEIPDIHEPTVVLRYVVMGGTLAITIEDTTTGERMTALVPEDSIQ